MGTFNDIRARFEMAINEVAKWKESMQTAYNGFKQGGRWIEPKTGEIMRCEFDPEEPENDIADFLMLSGIKADDYSIEPANYSGKFDSWGVTFNKPISFYGKDIKPNVAYAVINAVDFSGKGPQIIGDKDLTPDKLGLPGTFQSQTALIDSAKASISRTITQPDYIEFCHKLIDAVATQKESFNDVSKIEGIKQEFIINYDLNEYADKIDAKSIKTIEKDFGEILGGIFMFSLIGEDGSGVTFPQESNLKLVDFFFDGLAISSKAGKGAKASSSGYVAAIESAIKQANWQPTVEELDVLDKLLRPLVAKPSEPDNSIFLKGSRSSGTFSNSVRLFNAHLDSKSAWSYWIDETRMPAGNLNRDAIVQSFIDLKENGKLNKTISNFTRMTNIKSSGGKNGKLVNALIKARNEKQSVQALNDILDQGLYDILIGLILYGASKELQVVINNQYGDALTSIINKSTTVKQLYLDFKIKKDQIKFTIKAMENSNFKLGTLNGIDSWKTKAISIYMA